MNRLSARGARAVAAAGVVGAVSMLGLGAAPAASAATVSSPTDGTVKVASPTLQTSLRTVIWHPPYGCIVCGLGGFDPWFNDAIDPAILQSGIGF